MTFDKGGGSVSKKISRSGKKKKSVYREQQKAEKSQTRVSQEEVARLKKARNMHLFSLGLLIAAMVGILFAPSLGEGSQPYIVTMLAAYGATLLAGVIMSTIGTGTDVKRRRTNRIIGLLMVLLGFFGATQVVTTYLM